MAEHIDQILEKCIENGILHGIIFQAVNSKGEVVYSGSRGSLAVDRQVPLPSDALCWIASMTKLFTSVAIMQLCERGLVTLDESVASFLPELAHRDIVEGFDDNGSPVVRKAKTEITLRQLLSHQSGFAYPPLQSQLADWIKFVDGPSLRSSTGRLADYDTPLVFEPGECWMYGPGLDWAGRIVEVVSGKSLGEYMKENIFMPLGLKNTTFHPETQWDSLPRLLEMSVRTNDGARRFKRAPIPYASGLPAPEDLGGIGLYSTAPDYCKLLLALLQDGGPILRRDSVHEMLKPQIHNHRGYTDVIKGPFSRALIGGWDGDTEGDHSLIGTVNLTPLKGRRAADSVNWTGFPNLSWWVDLKSGVAGVVFVQLLPVGDGLVSEVAKKLERATYQMI